MYSASINGTATGSRAAMLRRSHSDAGADFLSRPMQLFNAASSRCLTSGGGAGSAADTCRVLGSVRAAMALGAADRVSRRHAQRALVSVATLAMRRRARRPARRRNLQIEGHRAALDAVGLRPRLHADGPLYGAVNGAVSIGRCSLLTAEYRWAVSPRSQWTDTREEGALYGDVRGAGRDSTVYIQRRKDGPGFNAWVAEMSRFEGAMPWYLNAVPFDPAPKSKSRKKKTTEE